jgi:hypothetical protein
MVFYFLFFLNLLLYNRITGIAVMGACHSTPKMPNTPMTSDVVRFKFEGLGAEQHLVFFITREFKGSCTILELMHAIANACDEFVGSDYEICQVKHATDEEKTTYHRDEEHRQTVLCFGSNPRAYHPPKNIRSICYIKS